MLLGVIPISFRFRGKLGRLSNIYLCFLDNDGKALHPTQIAKQTGIRFTEVSARLEATPELFVRLPKRDGITRYRLTSATAAKEPEEVEVFLSREARKESLLLWAFGTMVLLMLLIVVLLLGPAL
ncbi:MAG: hypothetical protein CMQ49_04105 [Gammaproteobacteria bacterium]|nr:hypothetical protein [Gammaproteobacteria bacterium]